MLTTLANRIRSARTSAELTQSELAGQLGVSAAAVAQWEIPGGTRPTLEHLSAIARVTETTVDWLMTGCGAAPEVGRDAPALELGTFAHDDFEERVLHALRALPRVRKREVLRQLESLSRTRRRYTRTSASSS